MGGLKRAVPPGELLTSKGHPSAGNASPEGGPVEAACTRRGYTPPAALTPRHSLPPARRNLPESTHGAAAAEAGRV